MKTQFNRREFLTQGALASLAFGTTQRALGEETNTPKSTVTQRPTAPSSKGTFPTGKIGKVTVSRLISGGNLLSGWCHQRDLLFVRNLAAAYLTEQKQFDTLQMLEELGVNSIVIDLVQLDIVNKYKKERGGKIQSIVSIREGWGDWSEPHFDDLKVQIKETIDKGPDLLYVHGGYADRIVQTGKPQAIGVLAQALEFIRKQGFCAGMGAHALEVLKECDKQGIVPDFYVKTFHHDKYWSATPKEHRKPFCVDGPQSLDHDEFHDNIFCLDAPGTAEYMLEKQQPWIAFKVLAAGAINPKSGFDYAFENGADFIAVGMFDFEVNEDVAVAKKIVETVQRDRPWRG